MAVIDSGSSGAGKANVDAGFNLNVALSNTHAYIGGVRLHSENDSGEHTGTPYLKSPETSPDYRMRAGLDTVLFNDVFNATLQNRQAPKAAPVHVAPVHMDAPPPSEADEPFADVDGDDIPFPGDL